MFYGAEGLYLRHRFPALRRGPRWVGRLLDSAPLLRAAASLSGATDPSGMGALTLSMLRGEEGGQSAELERLIRWIAGIRPDAVHLSNCLLLGIARRVRKEIRIPVACSLRDEHTWIDALGVGEREEAWEVFRERTTEVDLFLPVSNWSARFMGGRLAVPEGRMRVVPIGVDTGAFTAAAHALPFDPPVIGYLSQVSEDMGAGILTEAFLRLCESGRLPGLRLRFAGGSTAADAPLLRSIRRALARRGLLDRADFLRSFGQPERISFLSSLTVLSVPTAIAEASGSFLLESMAAGVPVVQPRGEAFSTGPTPRRTSPTRWKGCSAIRGAVRGGIPFPRRDGRLAACSAGWPRSRSSRCSPRPGWPASASSWTMIPRRRRVPVRRHRLMAPVPRRLDGQRQPGDGAASVLLFRRPAAVAGGRRTRCAASPWTTAGRSADAGTPCPSSATTVSPGPSLPSDTRPLARASGDLSLPSLCPGSSPG